jgi:hypothetical protein
MKTHCSRSRSCQMNRDDLRRCGRPQFPRRMLCLLCTVALLASALELGAADKVKAVVLLRQTPAGASPYLTLQKFKLNGKGEVRTLPQYAGLPEAAILKDVYKDASKIQLETVSKIVLERGVPRIYLAGGQPLIGLPDGFDFGKSRSAQLAAFTAKLFEGEGRDETPKGKKALPLESVWKVYFVPETTPLDETAFRHSSEEDSVPAWRDFFKLFPRAQRASEARALFHARLVDKAREELDRFTAGSYRSLADARQTLAEAESVLPGHGVARDLHSRAEREDAELKTTLDAGRQRLESGSFDAAVEVLSPVVKYRVEIASLDEVWRRSLEGSNREHRQKCTDLRTKNQLDEALKECKVAIGRLPDDPETRREMDEVSILMGLRDGQKLVDGRQWPEALQGIRSLSQKYPADSRLQALLNKAKDGRAQQLYEQARRLYAPAPSTPQSKRPPSPRPGPPAPPVIPPSVPEKDLRTGARMLEEAAGLAPGHPQAQLDLQLVRRRLSDVSESLAKRAAAKPKGGGLASSYLYLRRALVDDPGRSDLEDRLHQARDAFEKKATMSVAVRIRSKVRTDDASGFADQLEAAISSALVNARLPGISVVERDAISAIQSEQEILKQLSLHPDTPNLQRAVGLVVADVIVHRLRSTNQTIPRRSRWLASETVNPVWQDYENKSDYADSLWDSCRKQAGNDNPTCQNYRSQKEYWARMRDGVAQFLRDERDYSYQERQVNLEAALKISYRLVNSLTGIREADQYIEDGDRAGGTEITGAMENDLRGVRNQYLNVPEEHQFLQSIQQRVQNQLVQKTLEYCRSLPTKYYERAEAAVGTSLDEALENYALFLFSTPAKDGPEARKASAFLQDKFTLAFDGQVR